MKKNKLFVLLPALAIGASLLIASCGDNKANNNGGNNGGNNQPVVDPNPENPNNPSEPSNPVETTGEVKNDSLSNLQAVTAMNLLNFDSVSSMSGMSLSSIQTMDRNDPITNEEKQDIIDMLPTLDLLMMEDKTYESTIVESNAVVDGATFKYSETIVYLDNSLKDSTITLHYNVVDSWTRGNDFMQRLEGVALLNNDPNAYKFSSFTQSEESGREVEEERYFRIETGANSYILVEQESEKESNEEENEFEYTVVQNGMRDQYSVSIETERGQKSVSYELNNVEYEMKIRNISGRELYVVEYENESGWNETEATLYFEKIINADGSTSFVETTR